MSRSVAKKKSRKSATFQELARSFAAADVSATEIWGRLVDSGQWGELLDTAIAEQPGRWKDRVECEKDCEVAFSAGFEIGHLLSQIAGGAR